jgi:hypothetical protein
MTPPKDLGKAMEAGYQPMFMTGPEIKEHFAPHEKDKKTIDLPEHEKANRYDIGERKETDAELWDRKLKESKQTGEQRYGKESFERNRYGGFRTLNGPSLARTGIEAKSSLETVAKKSGIPGAVHVADRPGYPSDKPQILGGHHRIALSAEQFKDHIFPVKYARNLDEAKADPGYR